MKTSTKRIIIAIAMLQLIAIIGFLALPKVVEAIPTTYKDVLAERSVLAAEVMELVSTPYPTISAPLSGASLAEVVIPVLPSTTPTPTTQPTATPPSVTTAATAPTATQEPSPTPSPTAVPTLPPPPSAFTIDGLVVEPQNFNNCGPTNMTMVLNFYGQAITQADAAASASAVTRSSRWSK